jgi:hypothetical protein
MKKMCCRENRERRDRNTDLLGIEKCALGHENEIFFMLK